MATALSAAAPAGAQVPPETMEPGAVPHPTGGAWPVYPGERHILVRAEATTAARLSDPFSSGALAPVTAFVEGTYAFYHLGPYLLGPSVGLQLGFDGSGSQVAVQPGVALYRRFSPTFSAMARIDVPI